MKTENFKIGDRVLVQTNSHTREHAIVKAILDDNTILVRLSDYQIIR